jgi:O-acetyl-ADP-ribose deacetylase (regulator of RNase III)
MQSTTATITADNGRIVVMQGDITRLSVEVIVNAANGSLLGGGGVDGAIHRAAGPELHEECRDLGGCLTGDAKLTRGHRLPAGPIIHAVGPIWRGGGEDEDVLLASCYRKSLLLAASIDANAVAFPAISCGVYRFPIQRAAALAVAEVRRWQAEHDSPQTVIFCCFTQDVWQAYAELLSGA